MSERRRLESEKKTFVYRVRHVLIRAYVMVVPAAVRGRVRGGARTLRATPLSVNSDAMITQSQKLSVRTSSRVFHAPLGQLSASAQGTAVYPSAAAFRWR